MPIKTVFKSYGGLLFVSQTGTNKPTQLLNTKSDQVYITPNVNAKTIDVSFPNGGNYNINLTDAVADDLVINGVNFGTQTFENIYIALGAVFLSTNGGSGGGGSIGGTTSLPFIPYSSASNVLDDTKMEYQKNLIGDDALVMKNSLTIKNDNPLVTQRVQVVVDENGFEIKDTAFVLPLTDSFFAIQMPARAMAALLNSVYMKVDDAEESAPTPYSLSASFIMSPDGINMALETIEGSTSIIRAIKQGDKNTKGFIATIGYDNGNVAQSCYVRTEMNQAGTATVNSHVSKRHNFNLISFANNAAALLGGLQVGDLYRTANVVMVVI